MEKINIEEVKTEILGGQNTIVNGLKKAIVYFEGDANKLGEWLNGFLTSLALTTEGRKEVVSHWKEINPNMSERKVAKVLNVAHTTIQDDCKKIGGVNTPKPETPTAATVTGKTSKVIQDKTDFYKAVHVKNQDRRLVRIQPGNIAVTRVDTVEEADKMVDEICNTKKDTLTIEELRTKYQKKSQPKKEVVRQISIEKPLEVLEENPVEESKESKKIKRLESKVLRLVEENEKLRASNQRLSGLLEFWQKFDQQTEKEHQTRVEDAYKTVNNQFLSGQLRQSIDPIYAELLKAGHNVLTKKYNVDNGSEKDLEKVQALNNTWDVIKLTYELN